MISSLNGALRPASPRKDAFSQLFWGRVGEPWFSNLNV